MKRIREWALNPHPEHGYMCLEGVVKEVQAKPGDCGPMVNKTIRTSRIVGFGACEDGVIVHTKGEKTWDAHKPSNKYLLVGMSREDMIERAAMTGRTDSSEVNWDHAEKDDEELAEAMGDVCFL